MSDKEVTAEFHRIYYESGYQGKTWKKTKWLGVDVEKIPLDLWIYQEILFSTRPDLIIECGTFMGGSALFMASICDLMNTGRIFTVDIQDLPGRPKHSRIEYFTGDSAQEKTAAEVRGRVVPGEKVMVILDSNHFKHHVLSEMRLYSSLVSVGNYLIVEDGNVNGHPVNVGHGPGPTEAIEEFMKTDGRFQVDLGMEKFLLTFNPGGYLRRVR